MLKSLVLFQFAPVGEHMTKVYKQQEEKHLKLNFSSKSEAEDSESFSSSSKENTSICITLELNNIYQRVKKSMNSSLGILGRGTYHFSFCLSVSAQCYPALLQRVNQMGLFSKEKCSRQKSDRRQDKYYKVLMGEVLPYLLKHETRVPPNWHREKSLLIL